MGTTGRRDTVMEARVARRRRARFAAAVAFATTAIAAGCSGGSSAPPSESVLLGAGSTELRQGDYNAATQLFERAVAQEPTNATALYDLGTVYQAEGQDAAALTQYTTALRQSPDFVPAIFNQATLEAAKDPPLAAFLYRKVISLQPDSPTAYLNLGILEAQQGQAKQAGVDLRKAVQLDGSLRARIPASVAPDLALAPPQSASTPPRR